MSASVMARKVLTILRFEGFTFSLNIYVVAAMMLLRYAVRSQCGLSMLMHIARVRAMYQTRLWILCILGAYIAVEAVITAWLLTGAKR
jgi:hypothetical protein